MKQLPKEISLMVCDQVVFEERTQKPYLLGVFTGVAASKFPTLPQRFDAFAALTNGQGSVTIKLSVVDLKTDQEIYAKSMAVDFPDPLRVVNVRLRVRELVYETAGTYLFTLTADGEEIAARRILVYDVGGSP